MFKILLRLIQKYLQSSYFFGRRLVCAQTAIFFNEPISKKCGNYTFYVLRAVWCLQKGVRVVQHFRGFFHHIKMCPRIGRNYSIQVACRKMRKLEAFCIIVSQNFKLVSKIQIKILKFKTCSGYRPILCLSNSTTLRSI